MSLEGYTLAPINSIAGITPESDMTSLASTSWIDGDKVRFYLGLPEWIGGWESVSFADGVVTEVNGVPRNLFPKRIGSNTWLMIATHSNLYSLVGNSLYNVTPLDTATAALGTDPFDSTFDTQALPFLTTSGSTTVRLNSNIDEDYVQAGDTIRIQNVSGTKNGIPDTELNGDHIVREIIGGRAAIYVTTPATSTGSAGNAGINLISPQVRVDETAHGRVVGERIKIAGATTFAGIAAAELNKEHIVKKIFDVDKYIVDIVSFTTSAAAGGGASVLISEEIEDGSADASLGRGYGMGQYGVGKYGVSKTSSALLTSPRIWSFDTFGNNIICTPGGQKGVYQWSGDTDTAPALVTNAPTAVNYVFVSNNIMVTLGEGGQDNRVKWSNQGASTEWTSTSTNFAGEDDIEGANKWRSHLQVRGVNLLFTEDQVWTMRYIGRPLVWEFKQLDVADGIIAQNARVQVNGSAYWMGNTDFFSSDGNTPLRVPSTIRKYVFNNLNESQKSKCYAWYNRKFGEVWFHYPSGNSTEPDRYVALNPVEGHWTIGTMDRSAAEYPASASPAIPRLISDDGLLYRHESGVDADGSAMSHSLVSKYFMYDKKRTRIGGLVPDSIQTGDIDLTIKTKLYPQSTDVTTVGGAAKAVSSDTEKVDFFAENRLHQYTIAQNETGGVWRMGAWSELVAPGTSG